MLVLLEDSDGALGLLAGVDSYYHHDDHTGGQDSVDFANVVAGSGCVDVVAVADCGHYDCDDDAVGYDEYDDCHVLADGDATVGVVEDVANCVGAEMSLVVVVGCDVVGLSVGVDLIGEQLSRHVAIVVHVERLDDLPVDLRLLLIGDLTGLLAAESAVHQNPQQSPQLAESVGYWLADGDVAVQFQHEYVVDGYMEADQHDYDADLIVGDNEDFVAIGVDADESAYVDDVDVYDCCVDDVADYTDEIGLEVDDVDDVASYDLFAVAVDEDGDDVSDEDYGYDD